MNKKVKLGIFTAVAACCCLGAFTACDMGKTVKFAAPKNLRYDGAMITWDAVEKAEKYVVSVNGGAEITVSTNSFGYAANGAQFSFSVKAGADSAKVKEAQTASMTFSYLGKVEDSAIEISDDGLISWDAITGATAYEVKNDAEVSVIYTTEYQLAVGACDFQVRPTVVGDPSKYSSWSTKKKLVKCDVLDADDITYDGTYITFDAVTSAQKYELTINGQPVDELLASRKYAYDAGDEDFTVAVRAIGNHSNSFDGEKSAEKKFVFLDMVTGLRVSDGVLYWNGDEDKTYSLKINNTEIEVKGNTYSGSLLTTGSSLSVQIMEISTDSTYFSAYTSPLNVYILPAPTLVWSQLTSLDGGENSLSWNSIAGATGYTVTVTRPDGSTDPYNYGANQGSFSYDYDAVGTYTVTVVADADEASGLTSSSKPSTEFTVVRPARPERAQTGFIESDAKSLAKGFTVTCKTQSNDYSYKLYKNGSQDGEVSKKPQFTRTNLIEDDVIEGQEFTYSVQVIGKINSENRVTLNSREMLDFKITVLAMPQETKMDGFKFLYNPVAGATNNYWITGVNGSNNGASGSADGADLKAYLKSGEYNLRVCAMGNGSDVLASNYSPVTRVFRLGAPDNIHIDTNTSQNGVLKYTVSEMATSVELYLGSKDATQKVEADSNVLENMNSRIQTGGTYVSLVAVGNYLASDNVYYITSEKSVAKEFVKLAAPSNLSFDNTHLMWNQTGISEAQSGSVTYEIYNESGVLFTAAQNDRSVDISMLEGGENYTFSIRAIGNGQRYINSDISTAASVYKLNDPVVKRENGAYVWNVVTNATSYSVTVDGVLFDTAIHVSGGKCTFDPSKAFTQIKTYMVKVTAVGNGGVGDFKTVSSKPVEISQTCVQLVKPTCSVAYDKEYFDEQGNIVVSIETEVPYSSGYRYLFNNITIEKMNDEDGYKVCSYNPKNTGKYEIYINALGGCFNDKNEYTLTSQTSKGQTITLLGAPDQDDVKINKDGYLSFSAIDGADAYEIEVYINGSSVAQKFTVNSAGLDISRKIDLGEITGVEGYGNVVSLKVVIRSVAKTNGKVSSQTVTKEWSGNLH